jgi:hypothetical protein
MRSRESDDIQHTRREGIEENESGGSYREVSARYLTPSALGSNDNQEANVPIVDTKTERKAAHVSDVSRAFHCCYDDGQGKHASWAQSRECLINIPSKGRNRPFLQPYLL